MTPRQFTTDKSCPEHALRAVLCPSRKSAVCCGRRRTALAILSTTLDLLLKTHGEVTGYPLRSDIRGCQARKHPSKLAPPAAPSARHNLLPEHCNHSRSRATK